MAKAGDGIGDVPANSQKIAYGALPEQEKNVWLDDLKFEVVSDSVSASKSFLPDNP